MFGRSTIPEIDLEVRAAHARRQLDRADQISMAWHVALFMRCKKLPEHETVMRKILRDDGKRVGQSDAQMSAMLKAAYPKGPDGE